MRSQTRTISLAIVALATILLSANAARAQEDTTPKKHLRSPATVRGIIGGESHASYVIRARRGQTLTVNISWLRRGDNKAEFTVSESPNFFNGGPVGFGKSSEKGKRWTGKLPKTGNYCIYVVAHPAARYTLRVTVN